MTGSDATLIAASTEEPMKPASVRLSFSPTSKRIVGANENLILTGLPTTGGWKESAEDKM